MAQNPLSDNPTPFNPLEQFRSKTKRLAIHPLELALLWVVALHLVFFPWAIGGMRPWSQFISLALAAIGFVLALLPRNYTSEHTGGASFRLFPLPKLLKFPIFWLGLTMLVLVTTQALNPAWEYQTDGKTWWMRAIPYITWLPHSVRVPFAKCDIEPELISSRSLISEKLSGSGLAKQMPYIAATDFGTPSMSAASIKKLTTESSNATTPAGRSPARRRPVGFWIDCCVGAAAAPRALARELECLAGLAWDKVARTASG